jgi:glutaredoxin
MVHKVKSIKRSYRRKSLSRGKKSRQASRRKSRRRSQKTSRRKSKRKTSRRKSRKTSRRRRSKKISKKSRKTSRRKSTRKTSRRKSRKTSRRRRSIKTPIIQVKSKIEGPLTLYTADGCGACQKAKDLLNTKGIKFTAYQRKDHEDTVKRLTNDYKYIPVIIDRNNKFIGGFEELQKIFVI